MITKSPESKKVGSWAFIILNFKVWGVWLIKSIQIFQSLKKKAKFQIISGPKHLKNKSYSICINKPKLQHTLIALKYALFYHPLKKLLNLLVQCSYVPLHHFCASHHQVLTERCALQRKHFFAWYREESAHNLCTPRTLVPQWVPEECGCWRTEQARMHSDCVWLICHELWAQGHKKWYHWWVHGVNHLS